MRLEYNAEKGTYILRIPSADRELVKKLMEEYGLNQSAPASTSETTVLFTHEPYAAIAFAGDATPMARQALGGILAEVEASWAKTSSSRYWSPPDRELWDFQRADLDYALRRRNTLVADQPGLGKTPVAICYANEIKAHHALVICPANIRGQWHRRIREWSRMSWDFGASCRVQSITSGRSGLAAPSEHLASWNVVSYDLARSPPIGRALARERYDVLILDEAHYLKTTDSGRTRAVFGGGTARHFEPLASRCDHVLTLTGTPLPNRPREAYTLARAQHWDAIDWLSEDDFRERFNPSLLVEGQRDDGSWYRFVDERSGRHAELQARLRASFMVRHLKREVMTQLKMPVFDLIYLDEDAAIKAALAAEQLLDIDPDTLAGENAEVFGHIAEARHMMGLAMAPQIADYIDMLIDGGEEKLVVFAWHIGVLDILEKKLHKHGFLRIDGRTSSTQKDERVQRFIHDPKCQVICGNLQAMGVGTDGLQEVAWHGLIAEPSWVPGENIQAFDRLDRGGQNRTVQGDIFVVRNSLAERILAKALRKLRTTDAALDKKF